MKMKNVAHLEAYALISIFLLWAALLSMTFAIVNINGDLTKKESSCYQGWMGKECEEHVLGCLWTDDTTDRVPCSHCEGAAFFAFIATLVWLPFLETPIRWPVILLSSGFNIVWLAVAGDYFTKLFHDHRQLPKDGTRRTVVGLMWACIGVACTQFILAAAMMTMWKQLWELHFKHQEDKTLLASVQLSSPPPPLPLPASPATAAGVNTPVLSPGGSTFSAAPQPAGDTPSAVPGHGTAPLLGGYVRSMAVLLNGGYTALPGQPADAPVPPLQQ